MNMITEDRREEHKYQDRRDIPEQYLWNLQDIYTDETLWEKDFLSVTGYLEKAQGYREHVAESPRSLYRTLELQNKISALWKKYWLMPI